MSSLRGKRIWITGASSGIGAALALELSRLGAKLILTSRNGEQLERIAEQCEGHTALLPMDLTELDSCGEQGRKAEKCYGGIDLFIGNAGISQRSFFAETDYEVIRRIINTNLTANLFLVRSVLPEMKERKEGAIVLISSIAGKFGSPLRSVYSASKHALHGFVQSLRSEVSQDNISVSLVIPGFVRTNISYNALAADGTRYNRLDPNQGKGIEPEQCAQAVIKGIKKQKHEIYVGMNGKARTAIFVSRFFPGIFNRILTKADVR